MMKWHNKHYFKYLYLVSFLSLDKNYREEAQVSLRNLLCTQGTLILAELPIWRLTSISASSKLQSPEPK